MAAPGPRRFHNHQFRRITHRKRAQKNLVDHLIIGDSLEVEAAKLAVARTQNAAVKDFANTLVTDHTNHLENLNKLAAKRDIGREANAADTSSAMAIRMLTSMRAMPWAAASSASDASISSANSPPPM